MMEITYYQRRRRPNANFSLEFIFDDVCSRLSDNIQARVVIAPYFSNGLFRRLCIAWSAWCHQGFLTHVTGDINFAAIPLSRKRTILTILDCGFLERTTGFRRWLLKLLWLRLPVGAARIVTTISEAARQDILRHTDCDARKIRVIPVAVSDLFQRSPRQLQFDRPRVLLVGTAPNKNIPRILQALQSVSCDVVVIGKLSPEIIAAAQETQIEIENHVNLNQDQVVSQYERADLVVFASLNEGFGMPIVEAQRVGRPVVTSHLSSMPEVAGDGACLVDPYDVASIRAGIVKVITDSQFREQLIAKGFVNAQRFDGQQIAQQYLELYRELAAELQTKMRAP